MNNQISLLAHTSPWSYRLYRLGAGIGTKIILPYLLLTLAVAGVGAFVVTQLVANTLQERFHNQLLDAGRVVSESMVNYEKERLKVLRIVAGTEGVSQALITRDREVLAAWVPQIIANSSTDAVELLDSQGIEIYGWQRPPAQVGMIGEERSGADYGSMREVSRVLTGFVDEFGEKRVLLSQTPYGPMIFTLGPVYHDGTRVGVAMVGTYIHEMVVSLTENAIARVTLYDPQGNVIVTTLGAGQESITTLLREPAGQYQRILALLQEPTNRYQAVVSRASHEVPLKQVQVLGQQYRLAYGDWRLRGQSLGIFSVALPSTFIVSATATSRNLLSLVFSLATIGVFIIGFIITRRITQPLYRLVRTSMAVAEGDLRQRTGIRRDDEIGSLAHSFDLMTERLAERNRQLLEQASKLEAILNSIADGVIVLDPAGQIISSNRAAQQVLADLPQNFLLDMRRTSPTVPLKSQDNDLEVNQPPSTSCLFGPQRYRVGGQILSALAAPVTAPEGQELGTVIALRNITREAEAENLKDGFITGISHELRTPLTAVKGFSDLLLKTADGAMNESQLEFVRTINSNANKLMRHINQLIDISQIQANTLSLLQVQVELTPLIANVIQNWRERIEEKELHLQVNLPTECLWIRGDHTHLSWAIDNLLSNAYLYTPAGRIEVELFKQNSEARINIVDTGLGIAAADQPFLFTRFFRANNTQEIDIRGVGLGLYITKAILELHGGRIWAESKLGVGSTFSLALPLLDKDQVIDD